MANFIGIHRMQSLNSPQSQPDNGDGLNNNADKAFNYQMPFKVTSEDLQHIFGSGNDGEDEENYMCPVTGAHFHKADLFHRIIKLQKRRALIDRAIEEETKLQKRKLEKEKEKIKQGGKREASLNNDKQQILAPQQQAKGRNKSSSLGAAVHHGRQHFTDGNEQRAIVNKTTSQDGKIAEKDTNGVLLGASEDEQAVILNAGRSKYTSNRDVTSATVGCHAVAGTSFMSTGGGAMVTVGGTKISNQISSKTFIWNE